MIRKHENPVAIKAGVLSVLVHGALLLMLVLSVNFKSSPPVSYTEVELWDSLPNQEPIKVKVLPKIEDKIIAPIPEPPKKKSLIGTILAAILLLGVIVYGANKIRLRTLKYSA